MGVAWDSVHVASVLLRGFPKIRGPFKGVYRGLCRDNEKKMETTM